MIKISLSIEETKDRKISLKGEGSNEGETSKLEQEFTSKLLRHLNRFNSSFALVNKKHNIKMTVQKDGKNGRPNPRAEQ